MSKAYADKVSVLAIVFAFVVSPPIIASTVMFENKEIINQFKSDLKERLLSSINENGPAGSVSVCAKEAPRIASELSKKYSINLKRVSDKNRNPANYPSKKQKDIIQYFKNNPESSYAFFDESDGEKSIYAQPINTGPVCLSCHGESINEDIKNALKTHYPDDLATGYKLGDLRGIFVIERDIDKNSEMGIKNFRALSKDLWVGGQPSIQQLEKLKALGIKTIINLRSKNEMTFDEAELAKSLGMEYIGIPVAGSADITYSKSDYLRSKLESASGPVFLHCASSNRVGALLALDANKSGASIDDSLSIGRVGGMKSLEQTVTDILQKQ